MNAPGSIRVNAARRARHHRHHHRTPHLSFLVARKGGNNYNFSSSVDFLFVLFVFYVCVWFNFSVVFLCDFVQNICESFSRQSSSLSFHLNSTPIFFFERASHAREIRKNELHCTQQREREIESRKERKGIRNDDNDDDNDDDENEYENADTTTSNAIDRDEKNDHGTICSFFKKSNTNKSN
jgi:hypothetical protein